jgi:hypothetical protein
MDDISSQFFILSSLEDLLRRDSYSIISLRFAVAEPILPTTTPAARFANLTASSMLFPDDNAKPIEAKIVSPAPVTSNTSTATVG